MGIFGGAVRFIQKHPWWIIAICLALTVVMGLGLLFLDGQITYESLLPKDFPSIEALNNLRKQFGGIAFEYVLLKVPRTMDARVVRALFRLDTAIYRAILPPNFPTMQAFDLVEGSAQALAYNALLESGPSVLDPKVIEFMLHIEKLINEDPRFNKGQIEYFRDKDGNKVKDILGQPVPVVQDYLSGLRGGMKGDLLKRGITDMGAITNDNVLAMSNGRVDLGTIVAGQYLVLAPVRNDFVGKQKFITPSYDAALIMFKVGPKLKDTEMAKLGGDLKDFFRENLKGVKGLQVEIAGDSTLARDFDNHIKGKTVLLLLIALVFVILTLFLAFRRFTDTLLPIGIMFIGLVWALGFMGWLHIPYSVAAIAIMPLLLGTALTFVVPYVARYYEEMEIDSRYTTAIGIALATVGVGICLAAITNVFGFLVFEFSVLPPLRDFGLSCAFGTIFIFALSMTLLPATILIRDRLHEKMGRERKKEAKSQFDGFSRRRKRGLFTRATDRTLQAFASLAINHSTLVIIAFAIITLFGFLQIRNLTTDSDLRKLVPQDLPGIHADFEIEKYFGGQQQDVITVKGDVLSQKSLKAMEDFKNGVLSNRKNRYGQTELYPAAGIISLPDVLKSANAGMSFDNFLMPLRDSQGQASEAAMATANRMYQKNAAAWKVVPPTTEGVKKVIEYAQKGGGYVVGGVVTPRFDAALITLNGQGAQSPDVVNTKMKILEEEAKKYLAPAGLKYEIGGITPITRDMTKNIIPTETLTSILSLGLCALILVIIFRSVPYGLITLTVAFAGVSAELLFLWFMDWPLDIITSLVSALVIGIGVNFGILFTNRYMQEMKDGDKLPQEAVQITMMNLGRANIVAAIASVVAFVIIMFSGIVPLRRFGGVTAFAIAWCMIAAHTLMPALLYKLSEHRAQDAEKKPLEEEAPEPA